MSTELVPSWNDAINRLSNEMDVILRDETVMGFTTDAGVASAWCLPGEQTEKFIRAGWTLLPNGHVAKRASYPIEPAMVEWSGTFDCRPIEGLPIGDVSDLLAWIASDEDAQGTVLNLEVTQDSP